VYCLGAWLSLEHPLVLPDLSFLRWAHNRFQAEQRLDILWCSSHQLSSTFTSQLKQHIHFEKVGGLQIRCAIRKPADPALNAKLIFLLEERCKNNLENARHATVVS